MPIISEFDDEMSLIPKISQLDQAIAEVIGFNELVLMVKNPIRMGGRMSLHRQASLLAFEKKLEGPNVEILRVMLKYLNVPAGYPPESWDVDF